MLKKTDTQYCSKQLDFSLWVSSRDQEVQERMIVGLTGDIIDSLYPV
jgi:hypothetical protein